MPWVSVDHNPFGGAQGLPQAGQPTAMSQPTTNYQTTPEYMNNEDWDLATAAALMPGGQGRALATVMMNSPGHKLRETEAQGVGKSLSDLRERQRAGQQVLAMFKRLQENVSGYDDQTLDSAIGPGNIALVAKESPTLIPGTHIPIPGFSGPTTYDPKTNQPIDTDLTTVQRQALLNPQDAAATKAWNTQNRLQHDTGALVNAYIASAAKSGMNMSDSRQEAFTKAMGDFMKSTNRGAASHVLSDAGDMIHRVFGLVPPDAKLAPDGNYYVPDASRPGKWQKVVTSTGEGP